MLPPRCTAEAAHLAEIFSAIQGEGLLVGERQVFVRFLECHIVCDYCDTPDQDPRQVTPRLERTAGLRDWEEVPNPVARDRILEAVRRLQSHPSLHGWVAFTGGEPLWYWPMIRALSELREEGLRFYLETNGLLADELLEVKGLIDMVAMDVKLHPREHGFFDRSATLRFLERADGLALMLKVIVPASLDLEAFLPVAEALRARTSAPLILQPVTPYGAVTEGPGPDQMLAVQAAVNEVYPGTRVVPQVHKLIGQL